MIKTEHKRGKWYVVTDSRRYRMKSGKFAREIVRRVKAGSLDERDVWALGEEE